MTLTPKLEVLGRVSELAREIEGDDPPDIAMEVAMGQLIEVTGTEWAAETDRWPAQLTALEFVAAAAVNWIAVGPGGGS